MCEGGGGVVVGAMAAESVACMVFTGFLVCRGSRYLTVSDNCEEYPSTVLWAAK